MQSGYHDVAYLDSSDDTFLKKQSNCHLLHFIQWYPYVHTVNTVYYAILEQKEARKMDNRAKVRRLSYFFIKTSESETPNEDDETGNLISSSARC